MAAAAPAAGDAAKLLIRVRTPKQLLRLSVDPLTTVAQLCEQVAQLENVGKAQVTLSQSATGEPALPRPASLGELGLKNGDLLHAQWQSEVKDAVADKSWIETKLREQKKHAGSGLADNVNNLATMRYFKVASQDKPHVDYVEFVGDTIKPFVARWNKLAYSQQRFAWLYGTYEEKEKGGEVRAVVEAVYEPPQDSQSEHTTLLNDAYDEHVQKVAMFLGLQRVGCIFTVDPFNNPRAPHRDYGTEDDKQDEKKSVAGEKEDPSHVVVKSKSGKTLSMRGHKKIVKYGDMKDEEAKEEENKPQFYLLSASEVLSLAAMQIAFDPRFFAVVVQLDEKDNVNAQRVYQMSDQCTEMRQANMFAEEQNDPAAVKTKETVFITPKGRGFLAEAVDPVYFHVPLLAGQSTQRQPLLTHSFFRPANQPNADEPLGTSRDLKEMLAKTKDKPMHQRIANFDALLFISTKLGIQAMPSVCASVRNQTELEEGNVILIDSMANES